jgi:hypothetical protein
LNRWQAESSEQAGIGEHDDPGDAGGGRGEHDDPVGPVGAVVAAVVGGRGGLPVGAGATVWWEGGLRRSPAGYAAGMRLVVVLVPTG